MPGQSAGILVYRSGPEGLEVFLVHPGGPFYKNKDDGSWSIPKGEFDPADVSIFDSAKREFHEETGMRIDGVFRVLTPRKQPGGKIVHAWAIEGTLDAQAIQSNHFTMEWPPRSGRQESFPEIDRGGWFGMKDARRKMLKGQLGFLDELESLIGGKEQP